MGKLKMALCIVMQMYPGLTKVHKTDTRWFYLVNTDPYGGKLTQPDTSILSNYPCLAGPKAPNQFARRKTSGQIAI